MKGITEQEILQIISEESEKFQKRVGGKILGKKIAALSLKVLNKVDSSLEGENLRNLIATNFETNILPNVKGGVLKSLEDGTTGSSFAENLASVIHKYVSQENYYRTNDLKKTLLVGKDVRSYDRMETIGTITKAFESDDINLNLSEDLNEETEAVSAPEENSIIESASEEVKDSIDDAEEKAEVTRVILGEFKEVSDKAKEQQEAITPDPEAAIEALKFNSTEVIKSKIPVTAVRFALEAENGAFTKHKMVGLLLSLEDNGNYKEDLEFIQKRIDTIRNDAVNVVDFNIESVDGLQKIFNAAKNDVDGVFSSFRQLGFGRGDLPAAQRDTDTLNVIEKMVDLKSKSDDKRINDVQILIDRDVDAIKTPEDFINVSFESFEIRSAIASDIKDYEKYKEAIELRDDQIGEFMVGGLEHVPQARAERLRDINSGLKKLAGNDGLRQLDVNRLKSVYYKTAQLAKPEEFVDFKEEADRVKAFVKLTYNTDAYSEIVDDFFNGNGTSSHLSEENFYEVFAFKSAMEITAESGNIDAIGKRNIKAYAAVYSCYFKTLESLNILTKEDVKSFVNSVKKS